MSTPQRSNAASSSSRKKAKWKASAGAEAKKLGNREEWNLPTGAIGTTRAGRGTTKRAAGDNDSICTPIIQRDLFALVEETGDGGSTVSSLTDTSSSPRKKSSKPRPTCVLIEVDKVVELLEKHLAKSCPACKSSLHQRRTFLTIRHLENII